jgi:hypothetical protein
MGAFNLVADHVERRHGIAVLIGEVTHPNTGDFNGLEIKVDHDQDLDFALFVLIHLFGHTVQWNISDSLRELGLYGATGRKSEEELLRIHDYERDATRYSLALLHDAGLYHFDRLISDLWHADWLFLRHFYRTGERLDVRALVRPGECEILPPLSIPGFTPRRWESRWSF